MKHCTLRGWQEWESASPLGNGGRGLKPLDLSMHCRTHSGIAPRQRGAWIETWTVSAVTGGPIASPLGNGGRGLKPLTITIVGLGSTGIAPRQRGAWIETARPGHQLYRWRRIAPRQRGAWIETAIGSPTAMRFCASPLGNGGRGLKQPAPPNPTQNNMHRPSATGGVD